MTTAQTTETATLPAPAVALDTTAADVELAATRAATSGLYLAAARIGGLPRNSDVSGFQVAA